MTPLPGAPHSQGSSLEYQLLLTTRISLGSRIPVKGGSYPECLKVPLLFPLQLFILFLFLLLSLRCITLWNYRLFKIRAHFRRNVSSCKLVVIFFRSLGKCHFLGQNFSDHTTEKNTYPIPLASAHALSLPDFVSFVSYSIHTLYSSYCLFSPSECKPQRGRDCFGGCVPFTAASLAPVCLADALNMHQMKEWTWFKLGFSVYIKCQVSLLFPWKDGRALWQSVWLTLIINSNEGYVFSMADVKRNIQKLSLDACSYLVEKPSEVWEIVGNLPEGVLSRQAWDQRLQITVRGSQWEQLVNYWEIPGNKAKRCILNKRLSAHTIRLVWSKVPVATHFGRLV